MNLRISSKRAALVCAALAALIAGLQSGQIVVPPAVQPYLPLVMALLVVIVAVLRPTEAKHKAPRG